MMQVSTSKLDITSHNMEAVASIKAGVTHENKFHVQLICALKYCFFHAPLMWVFTEKQHLPYKYEWHSEIGQLE